MAFTKDGLFQLEVRYRLRALELRKDWPKADAQNPEISQPVREHTVRQNAEADDYLAMADILLGLWGDWDRLGPLLRASWIKTTKPARDAAKHYAEAHGDAA